ncbi:MAG TPA: GNAT family N-acetyltransferase [Rhodobacteraceae bacterium]|nr:GNAT family N-acetyltransferase [Paracoccaceae bacterium]
MGDTAETTIRPLEAEDWTGWRELWTGYLRHYETEVGQDVYETTFRRLLSGADGEFRGLIALRGGRRVGLAHYLFHRHCWKLENTCYLQDLFTAPDMRGHGVGRALIRAVYAAADREAAPSVYWLTQDFNTPARRLYDRVGTLTPFIKYVRP